MTESILRSLNEAAWQMLQNLRLALMIQYFVASRAANHVMPREPRAQSAGAESRWPLKQYYLAGHGRIIFHGNLQVHPLMGLRPIRNNVSADLERSTCASQKTFSRGSGLSLNHVLNLKYSSLSLATPLDMERRRRRLGSRCSKAAQGLRKPRVP